MSVLYLRFGGQSRECIVISTDKGLCGGLNSNLMRSVLEDSSDMTSYVTIGSKGRSALALAQKDLIADFPVSDPVTSRKSVQLRNLS